MERIPSWEANRFSASQEIPRILRNANVHYRVYKSPSPVPFLNHINAVHTPSSHCPKTHFIIILLS
jgi:hypothetical protein